MTLEKLKNDVQQFCDSVNQRDDVAQTRIAQVLPELISLVETINKVIAGEAKNTDIYTANEAVIIDILPALKGSVLRVKG